MSILTKIAGFFLRATGKRRYFLSALLGICATLTLPPVHFLPLLFLSCCGLFWLLQTVDTVKKACYTGWWYGFGYFVSGIYWIAFALLTDPEQFGWMVPFAVFGLSGILALYFAFFALCFYRIPVKKDISRVIVFILLWVGMEGLRAYLFTGFPWNLIGYAWMASDNFIQAASVVGIYGLSLVAVLVAVSPVLWVRIQPDGTGALQKNRIVWAILLLPVLMYGGGAWRLSHRIEANVEGVKLRIVQANIPQNHKWQPELRAAMVQKYITLTQSPGYKTRTHIIWPETAMPYYLNETPWAKELLGTLAPPHGAVVTGALRTDFSGSEEYQIWNSLFAVKKGGRITSYYDKFHLVPFGEYVPFRTILPLEKITQGSRDFSTGPGVKTLDIPGLPPVQPLICYEIIFPQHGFHHESKPQVLLNITNDAWFGTSSGPYQHFAMARMRAVEQGVPLVRAANTGISAVVDSYGIVKAKLGLNQTGVVDAELPSALLGYTIYSRWCAYIIPVLIASLCSALFFLERIRQI